MATPERNKKYYMENREACIERARKWASNNSEKTILTQRKWRYNNLDRASQHAAKYRKDNRVKYLYNLAKRRALKKGQEFTISLFDLPEVNSHCPLLGIKFDNWSPNQGHHISIDRIDSSKGYIPGNVWFISHRANMLKNNATVDEMLCLVINWMNKVEEN